MYSLRAIEYFLLWRFTAPSIIGWKGLAISSHPKSHQSMAEVAGSPSREQINKTDCTTEQEEGGVTGGAYDRAEGTTR